MEQQIYERPREKLQAKGPRSLTILELLQIIIGSGNREVSSAKLARQVLELLEAGELRWLNLLKIKGLGVAKACQIIAAVELGTRYDGRDAK